MGAAQPVMCSVSTIYGGSAGLITDLKMSSAQEIQQWIMKISELTKFTGNFFLKVRGYIKHNTKCAFLKQYIISLWKSDVKFMATLSKELVKDSPIRTDFVGVSKFLKYKVICNKKGGGKL